MKKRVICVHGYSPRDLTRQANQAIADQEKKSRTLLDIKLLGWPTEACDSYTGEPLDKLTALLIFECAGGNTRAVDTGEADS